jgi:hypothetical protein
MRRRCISLRRSTSETSKQSATGCHPNQRPAAPRVPQNPAGRRTANRSTVAAGRSTVDRRQCAAPNSRESAAWRRSLLRRAARTRSFVTTPVTPGIHLPPLPVEQEPIVAAQRKQTSPRPSIRLRDQGPRRPHGGKVDDSGRSADGCSRSTPLMSAPSPARESGHAAFRIRHSRSGRAAVALAAITPPRRRALSAHRSDRPLATEMDEDQRRAGAGPALSF